MKGINNVLRNNFIGYSFLLLVLGLLSIYFYKDTIYFFPSYIHSWSQSDRYALALGFLNNGFDILHPTTYNLDPIYPAKNILLHREGITGVDFPIHEFVIAIIMKVIGDDSSMIFRLYNLIYSIVGLFFLFRTIKNISNSNIKSILGVLFVSTSPVYVYYQAGFIPSITSFANVLIGFYFFYSYKKKYRQKDLLISVFFFTLATLSRTSFVLILFSAFLQQLLCFFIKRKINIKELIAYLISFVLVILSSLYKYYLNNKYGSIFLSEIMPVVGIHELKEILILVYNHWFFQYFTLYHYIAFVLIISFSIIVLTKQNLWKALYKNEIFQFSIISIAGGLSYFLIMAKQFPDHDYYFIDSLFFPIVILFVSSLKYVPLSPRISKVIFITFTMVLSIGFIYKAKSVQIERYTFHDWDKGEIGRTFFSNSKQYLDSLQIPLSSTMLVIDAYSVNGPLILMNRRGYTVLTTSKEKIDEAFALKPDYVILQDQYILTDVVKNYPEIINKLKRVSGNGKISVYTINNQLSKSTLSEFLGTSNLKPIYFSKIDFDSVRADEHWDNVDKISIDSIRCAYMDSLTEYGATFHLVANKIEGINPQKLLFKGKFLIKEASDIFIVTSIDNKKEQVYYHSFNIKDYANASNNWQEIELLFVLPLFQTTDDQLKCYIWNSKKADFKYDDLSITIY